MPTADTSYLTSAIPRLRHTYYAIFLATPSLLSATPPSHISPAAIPYRFLRCPHSKKNVRQPIRMPDALS